MPFTGLSTYRALHDSTSYLRQLRRIMFTVEYSVRSAANAVYGLLGIDRKPPAVYKGQYDPSVLYKAFKGLHGIA